MILSVRGDGSSHWAGHKAVNLRHLLLPQWWGIAKRKAACNIIYEELGNVENWVIGKMWNFFSMWTFGPGGHVYIVGQINTLCVSRWKSGPPDIQAVGRLGLRWLPPCPGTAASSLSRLERCIPEFHPTCSRDVITECTSVGTRTKGLMRVHLSSSAGREWQSHDQEKVRCDWRTGLARYFN